MKNIEWIDTVKAICMIAVYLLHCEGFYGTGGTSYGYALMPFYVNAFFLVSGYLFFRKHLGDKSDIYNFSIKEYLKNILNIVFRLIIPTIIFSTIIFLPKMVFHDSDISISKYFYEVFGGLGNWFISALTVSQIILLTTLFVRRKSIWIYFSFSIMLFIGAMYLIDYFIADNSASIHFPWFYKTGLVYTLFMTLGGVYYKYEDVINKILKYIWPLFVAIYVYCVATTWESHSLLMARYNGRIDFVGFVASLSAMITLILISKRIPFSKWLSYIGRNSIVYCFLSGVIPAAVCKIVSILFPQGPYLITIFTSIISVVVGYFATKILLKYFSFLVDLRQLKKV